MAEWVIAGVKDNHYENDRLLGSDDNFRRIKPQMTKGGSGMKAMDGILKSIYF